MTDEEAMARAVVLAARGLGSTSPNPSVGCLVLDAGGAVVGEGRTEPPADAVSGYPGEGRHAEVVALAAAGDRARGGTAVVTLEPCAHRGRTPPCTDALREAGVVRVVHALPDPSPGAGGGAEVLRAAGVDVRSGTGAAHTARTHEAWLTAVRTGRPHVHVKLATSLDGRVAAADGTSKWITSERSRTQGRALRGTCDAVLAGVGTVVADDPALTVRDADGRLAPRQPWRVVVDSSGRTPPDAQVLDRAAPVLLATTTAARLPPLPDHVVVVRVAPARDGRVDLVALLAELHARGMRSLLVEGGPTLVGAVVDDGLVDRVTVWVAPLLLGGQGLPGVGGRGAATLADAVALDLDDVEAVGPDVRLSARVRDAAAESGGAR